MTRPARRRTAGITLIELVVTVAVMGILLATVMPLFITTSRGYTAMEVGSVLPAATQTALNRIQHRLVENKRLFGNDAVGNAFLARATPNVTPAAMTGSALPVIAANMSLSPTSGTFVAANIGNSLFFASLFEPKDLTVLDGGGVSVTDRIDTSLFNYYYMTLQTDRAIGPFPSRVLREWHSVPYADYQQLMGISNATERANLVTALRAAGVLYAWDSSVSTVNTAFYNLNAGGGITASAAHTIQRASGLQAPKEMIKLIEGVASGGFRYSVSPNTGNSFLHNHTVPAYGTANAGTGFPSGFEAAIVGTNSARQVFIRLVMAAQGNFKGYRSYGNVLLVTARDLY